MLWVNTVCQAVQVPISSHDIVAVSIATSAGTALVISAYDPNSGDNQTENRQIMEQKLALIRRAIDEVCSRVEGEVEIILCSDFNRHHCLWGGSDRVVARRRNEGVPLVHFAQEYGLQSMLPAGTITWQHVGMEGYSSIDVIMASAGLAAQLIRCSVHEHDHGSDHQPIVIEFDLCSQTRKPKPSRLFRKGGLGADRGGDSTKTRVCAVTSECNSIAAGRGDRDLQHRSRRYSTGQSTKSYAIALRQEMVDTGPLSAAARAHLSEEPPHHPAKARGGDVGSEGDVPGSATRILPAN